MTTLSLCFFVAGVLRSESCVSAMSQDYYESADIYGWRREKIMI